MKDFTMCILLDFYASLLSDKQKEMMELYYNEDLSVSEIAEGQGITRQGAWDAVHKAEKILQAAEEEMSFVKRFLLLAKELGGVREKVLSILEQPQERDRQLKELLGMIDEVRQHSGVNDYGI